MGDGVSEDKATTLTGADYTADDYDGDAHVPADAALRRLVEGNRIYVEALDHERDLSQERIADLFSAMAPRRRTLLGMITFCAAPQTTDALDAEVDRLQTDNFSVYSPASLANLLERAGALARVTADGEPYPEGDPEPVLVEVDGVSYYEVGEAPEVCWLATEDGAAYAEADKPLDRLTNLLAEDAKYATIYERILGLTAQDAGASMPTINEAVDNDELLKSPRLYAPHFIDKLEKCDAVEWRDKSWRITEVGRAGQRIVADLVAAQAAPEPEAQADKGAETGETTADAQ